MKNMKRISCSIIFFTISACGINQSYIDKATPVIGSNPACMNYITDTSYGGFNTLSTITIAGTKASLAVATDGVNAVCGYASTRPGDVTGGWGGAAAVSWEQVDQVSMARCEQRRAAFRPEIKSPCKVFSHNYNIIYGQEVSDEK